MFLAKIFLPRSLREEARLRHSESSFRFALLSQPAGKPEMKTVRARVCIVFERSFPRADFVKRGIPPFIMSTGKLRARVHYVSQSTFVIARPPSPIKSRTKEMGGQGDEHFYGIKVPPRERKRE